MTYIENEMRWAMKKYKKLYPEKLLPHITPHVFRHTFCTNMENAGMDGANIRNMERIAGADLYHEWLFLCIKKKEGQADNYYIRIQYDTRCCYMLYKGDRICR